MTRFEDLPNEMIYEIIEYLNFTDAFEIFSTLNKRFENLFFNLPSFVKLDFSLISKRNFHQCLTNLFEQNWSRLKSLRLSNPMTIDLFLSFSSLNERFSQLENLIFDEIDSNQIEIFMESFFLLPRLCSLTLNNYVETNHSIDFYDLIFALPQLKYLILSPKRSLMNLSFSMSIDRFSSIEYFHFNRHCSLEQFLCLISSLPFLHHFSCFSLTETKENSFDQYEHRSFARLTHLSVKSWRLCFDTMKKLSMKCLFDLEVFRLCTRADDHYLMADRWEQLIVHQMSNLRLFDFQHYWEPLDNNQIEQRTYHQWIDRFNSIFWIERQWFFAHQHFIRGKILDSVFYSTDPFRRNLYELHERAHFDSCLRNDRGKICARRVNIDDYRAATNSSLQFPLAKELCLWGKGSRGNFSFIADLSHMFQFHRLTHLSIQCPDFGLSQLIELFRRLPNLTHLTLYSQSSYLSDEQSFSSIDFNSIENRISQLIVRGQLNNEQIHLLMQLCPRMKSFQLEIDEDQLESFIRFVFTGKFQLINGNEIVKEKSSFFKEFDSWQKKFSSLFSRGQNKKINSNELIPADFGNVPTNPVANFLFSLCFFNPTMTMEQQLQRFLQHEKFIEDYSIRLFSNCLYLWW